MQIKTECFECSSKDIIINNEDFRCRSCGGLFAYNLNKMEEKI